jgi:stalled ribosome rescue protein Dom34
MLGAIQQGQLTQINAGACLQRHHQSMQPIKETHMPTFHAVVWMDQEKALILMLDREHSEATRLRSHNHNKQRAGHPDDAAFYADIASALKGAHEVLLAGPGQAHEHFKIWCAKHQPATAAAIVASEPMDHPTEGQLLAAARKFFRSFDNMTIDPALA